MNKLKSKLLAGISAFIGTVAIISCSSTDAGSTARNDIPVENETASTRNSGVTVRTSDYDVNQTVAQNERQNRRANLGAVSSGGAR